MAEEQAIYCDHDDYEKCFERGDGSAVSEGYEVRACRCKSWFCGECAKRQGLALRRRAKIVLACWGSFVMVTLTVDPELFTDPESAYRYVRGKRGLSRLVEGLKRRGLITGRYLWVLEFHESGWPHWHLLLEGGFVPIAVMSELWGKLRPAGVAPVDGRPAFGHVWVSAPRFANSDHAANYATKYLYKEPRYGWPAWVLAFEGRLARYGVSRGFWDFAGYRGPDRCRRADSGAVPHPDGCFCEECREGINPRTGKPWRKRRTPGEIVAGCCTSCVLVRVRREWVDGRGVVETQREVVGVLADSLERVAGQFRRDGEVRNGCWRVGLGVVEQVAELFWGAAQWDGEAVARSAESDWFVGGGGSIVRRGYVAPRFVVKG